MSKRVSEEGENECACMCGAESAEQLYVSFILLECLLVLKRATLLPLAFDIYFICCFVLFPENTNVLKNISLT